MPVNTDKKLSGNLWFIVLLLLFVVLLVAAYKFKQGMMPTIIATVELDKSCNLRKSSCSLALPNGGKVDFAINPNDIPVLRPLELSVIGHDATFSAVQVDFVGVDMDMGYNRSTLEKKDKSHFTGKAVIPVCVQSKMEWEARLLLQTDQGLIMAPFRFYTTN